MHVDVQKFGPLSDAKGGIAHTQGKFAEPDSFRSPLSQLAGSFGLLQLADVGHAKH